MNNQYQCLYCTLGKHYSLPNPLSPGTPLFDPKLSEQWIKSVENFNHLLAPLLPKQIENNPQQDQDPFEQELSHTILKMRRLLRESMGDDVDIASKLKSIANNSQQFKRALVAWVSFIDTLLGSANQRHGANEHHITTREVKASVRLLYRSRRFNIAHIPNWLKPIIIDMTVSFSVDVIRLIAKRHGLWDVSKPPKISWLRKSFNFIWRSWLKLLTPAILTFSQIYRWCSNLYWKSVRLSPEVLAAIAEVEKESFLFNSPGNTHSTDKQNETEEALDWVQQNRPKILAFIELILAAVHEAERLHHLSGKEKKRYATRLILAVLDDMGIKLQQGLMTSVITHSIDSGIEVFVHMFRKHGVFSKTSMTTPETT